MNQYALRYEKTYPAVEDWKRISYGLTQIMGDNLDVLMLDQPVDADKCLRLLHSPADQLEISREHFHKCPSHDLWDNLRYWNTGHCDDSQDGRKYIDLVMGASEYLKQKQIDSRGYYVL